MKKGIKKLLLISIALLLSIGATCYYLFFLSGTTNVYQIIPANTTIIGKYKTVNELSKHSVFGVDTLKGLLWLNKIIKSINEINEYLPEKNSLLPCPIYITYNKISKSLAIIELKNSRIAKRSYNNFKKQSILQTSKLITLNTKSGEIYIIRKNNLIILSFSKQNILALTHKYTNILNNEAFVKVLNAQKSSDNKVFVLEQIFNNFINLPCYKNNKSNNWIALDEIFENNKIRFSGVLIQTLTNKALSPQQAVPDSSTIYGEHIVEYKKLKLSDSYLFYNNSDQASKIKKYSINEKKLHYLLNNEFVRIEFVNPYNSKTLNHIYIFNIKTPDSTYLSEVFEYSYGQAIKIKNISLFNKVLPFNEPITENHAIQLINNKIIVAATPQVLIAWQNINNKHYKTPIFDKTLGNYLLSAYNYEYYKKFGNALTNQKCYELLTQLCGGELVYLNAIVAGLMPDTGKMQLIWQIKLPQPIIKIEPLNLNNKNKEIYYAVTDSANVLYLINKFGNIIWQKQLSQAILGTIKTIDFFKNGKKQLLFNTPDSLFLIDRLGNPVSDYPIKFKTTFSTGVCVSYNNENIYLCTKNKLIVLNKNGKKLNFWDTKIKDNIKNIESYTYRNKEFIVVQSNNTTKIYNPTGKLAIPLYDAIKWSESNKIYPSFSQNYPRFIGTNQSGTIYTIYPDGHSETLNLGQYSANHIFKFINNSYVFADSNKLEIKSLYENILFTENEVINDFAIINNKLCILNKKGTLNLYTIKGEKELTLNEVTNFSINELNNSENYTLIIGNLNKFLYYYKMYF